MSDPRKNYPRDMVGYGPEVPHAMWPNGARIAVQFVLNYEEGGENCVLHGDAASETFLSEMVGAVPFVGARHMSMESLYEYGSRAREVIRDEIRRAIAEDRCEAVVLGCAGMTDLTAWLSAETGVPVIDGVAVAVKMVEALVGAGLKTSKVGASAAPRAKEKRS